MLLQNFFPLLAIVILVPTLYSRAARATEDSKGHSVNLDQAKKFAVSQNYRVQALREKVNAVDARRQVALAPFYPEIGVVGGVQNLTEKSEGDSTSIGYAYASYNIFRGFRDTSERRIQNLELQRAELEFRQAEFLVGLDVEEYFHTYLHLDTRKKLTDQALGRNSELQRAVERKRGSGLVSPADFMEFEIRESLLKSEQELVLQELEEARVNLKRILGEEIGSKIQPTGSLSHEHLELKLEELVAHVQEHNAEIEKRAKELETASARVSASRSHWYPEIDFEARAGNLPRESLGEGKAKVSLLLTAKLPIFSGFSGAWKVREAKAELAASQAELKDRILNLVADVETHYRKLKAIEGRVDLEATNAEKAKKYFDAILKEYSLGVKNSVDLNSAASQLYEANLRTERFKLDFLLERIALERLLGKPLKTKTIEEAS